MQKKGKKAAPIDHFFVKMFAACAWVEIGMTAGVFGGFSRAFLVEGHACFDSTQVGYLNSAGTSWCKLTGFAASQRLRRTLSYRRLNPLQYTAVDPGPHSCRSALRFLLDRSGLGQ